MTSSTPLALGIDVGSTNVKACLADPSGLVVGSASRSLHTTSEGQLATQDPAAMWAAALEAAAEAVAASARGGDVAAVGVCSQYSSVVPVATDGTPTGPVVMWMDTRGSDHCWEIMGAHPEAFDRWVEHHGIPPVGAGLTLAHLLHLQRDEPELHARTANDLEPMDYVIARLTGRRAATQCSMFAAQLVDNRTVGTTVYDAELLALSGVDADRLPELVGIDEVVAGVGADVAAALGIPAGTPVWAGMNDSHAGAFATGAFGSDRLGLMIGTTAVLLDTVDRVAADLDHEVVSMPAPVPGRYLVWAENGVAGRSVEHALTLLGASFDDLGAAFEASAPGAGGVLFLPWLAGSLSPAANRSMRGGWIDVGVETTRAELLRAAVEGTARNLRWLLPHVEAFSGHTSTAITFGGGAARLGPWAQTVADVLGRPVDVLASPSTAAAAAVALVALRRQLGDDPVGTSLPVATRVEPDVRAAAAHDELQPHFEVAFEAILPICQALHPVL